MKTPNVLLIRVNSTHELFHTRKAPERLRAAFPGARVVTVATPRTETLELLKNDPRIDEILLFPSESGTGDKSPMAFKRFMAGRQIDVTVACHGAVEAAGYQRQIVSLLLCPGRKMLLDKEYRLFPLVSARGLGVVISETMRAFRAAVSRRVARISCRLGKRLMRQSTTDIAAERDSGAINRVLWIRLDNIGDAVMSMPAFRALQANFPKAKIDVLIQSGSKPIFIGLPEIGEIFVYNPPRMFKGTGKPSSKWQWLSLVSRLRRNRYDLAVETRGNPESRIIAYASGARRRVGPLYGAYELLDQENFAGLMTHAIPLPEKSGHAVENSLKVIEGAGLDVPNPRYRFGLAEGDQEAVAATLAKRGVARPFAVIHGRSVDEMRQWPPERFAAVADCLIAEHDLDVILTGSPDDKGFNEILRNSTANTERVFNLAGRVELADLPALFRFARIMVTVDTGPMHIAAATGTPIVSLFLPWFVSNHAPFGQEDGVLTPFEGTLVDAANRECFAVWRGDYLSGISVEDAVHAIRNKLSAPRS